jgi:crotonobetainyl-CoA:carnitine CoA-transferase CaiB-like acyl-CoA transferase
MRESVFADAQVSASGLLHEVDQPGLGVVRMLGSLVGGAEHAEPAPQLGADTEAILRELA